MYTALANLMRASLSALSYQQFSRLIFSRFVRLEFFHFHYRVWISYASSCRFNVPAYIWSTAGWVVRRIYILSFYYYYYFFLNRTNTTSMYLYSYVWNFTSIRVGIHVSRWISRRYLRVYILFVSSISSYSYFLAMLYSHPSSSLYLAFARSYMSNMCSCFSVSLLISVRAIIVFRISL